MHPPSPPCYQGGEETTKVQKIALFGQTGELDKFNVAGEMGVGKARLRGGGMN